MDFLIPGSGNAINVFIILTVAFVFMFVRGKISFKQLLIISLVMIVLVMVYIKHETKSQDPTKLPNQQNIQQIVNDVNKISQPHVESGI